MTLARRLLAAAGGGASFPATVYEAFEVTADPGGGWPFADQAYYREGISYIGWADSDGNSRIGAFTNATRSFAATTLKSGAVDHHNAPGFVRRSSDGRLVAVYDVHGGANIYRRITTNPDDVSAWGSEANIDSELGGSAYGYPTLFQLGDETDDPIYLFLRDQTGGSNYWRLSSSTDGGSTWSALTTIMSGVRWYAMCAKASESRLDFAVTDGSYAEDYASLWHFYYEGGAYYKSDGSSAGSLPLTTSDMTLVYDGATEGARVPTSILNDGSGIVIVFPVQTGTPTGHVGTDAAYKYARWDGASWTVRTPVASIGHTEFELPEGGCVVDPSNIDRCVFSIWTGGQWRLWVYTTPDAGATWSAEQITSSGDMDVYARFIMAHAPGLEFVWLKGTITDPDTFDLTIMGWGVA